jgi:hypothetical protein
MGEDKGRFERKLKLGTIDKAKPAARPVFEKLQT